MIRAVVEDFGDSHQGTDDAGIQANGVGQIDHYEGGKQCVDHVASNIAGAIADLVKSIQISLFSVNANIKVSHLVEKRS